MIGVNVLPESYVYAHKRAARIRGWLIAAVLVGVVFAFPVGYDTFKAAHASSLEDKAEPLRNRVEITKTRLGECMARVTDLQQQLARADALRSKRPWKDLLTMLIAKMPEEVWLTSLESLQNEKNGGGRGASRAPAATESDDVELAGPSGLRLTGYALSHEHLYRFMGTLNAGDLFDRVDLVKAGQEQMAQATAVRFVLECAW